MQKFTKSFGSNNQITDLLQPPPLYNGLWGGGGNPERDVNLVECEGCKKWFHPSCKNNQQKILNSDLEYFCGKKCKTNSAY